MSDFSKFDIEKNKLSEKLRILANKVSKISVYNINEIEDLIITFFKLYSFMLMNKKLDMWLYIERLFNKIRVELLLSKITMKEGKG